MKKQWLVLVGAWTFGNAWAADIAVQPLRVSQQAIDDYWVYSASRTPSRAPVNFPALVDAYGELQHHYELVIDGNGRAVAYRLISLAPAHVTAEDRENLRVWALYSRYQPGPKNHEARPVVVELNKRLWDPDRPGVKAPPSHK